MVKLTGPGFSRAAGGTLSNVLTFGKTGATSTLRKKPTPKQPRSGLQISMRAMMEFLSQQWTNISTSDKSTWRNAYPDPQLNNYNSYLRYNLERWRSFRPPSKAFPATETGLHGYPHALTLTGHVRHTVCDTWFNVAPRDAWTGFLYYRHPGIPLDTVDRMIHVFRMEDANHHYWTHSPLPPGQHYYRMTQGTATGFHYTATQPTDNAPVT